MNTVQCSNKEEYEEHIKTLLSATVSKFNESGGVRGYMLFLATDEAIAVAAAGNEYTIQRTKNAALAELGRRPALSVLALAASLGLLAGFFLGGVTC